MSNPSITKKAYARGIGETLQRQGIIQYPNGQLLKHASDQAAGLIQRSPESQEVSNEECVKVAQYLLQVNDQLAQNNKLASDHTQVTIGQSPNHAFGDLLQKVAEASMGQPGGDAPTAVGMADHNNTLGAAAAQTDLAAKEQMERPENYARIQPGGGNIGEGSQANLGKEQDHPKQPNDAPGSNSVTQASKSASVQETLRKLGMDGQPGGDGPTAVGMKDHSNTLPAAAGETDVAKQENMNRPENYANVGQGNANIDESANANLGEEQPHPDQDKGGDGSNSVTQASKSASQQKLAHSHAQGKQDVSNMLRNLANMG